MNNRESVLVSIIILLSCVIGLLAVGNRVRDFWEGMVQLFQAVSRMWSAFVAILIAMFVLISSLYFVALYAPEYVTGGYTILMLQFITRTNLNALRV